MEDSAMRCRTVVALLTGVLAFALTSAALAQVAVQTATGTVAKADKDSVTIQPRGAKGEFGKALTLKVTGTTKISMVTEEKRGKKKVPIQRDADAKDLSAGQHISVIYVGGKGDHVLLSAVVSAGDKK